MSVCLYVCIVAKSQVSDFNGSRLGIVGVISHRKLNSYDQLLRSALVWDMALAPNQSLKCGTNSLNASSVGGSIVADLSVVMAMV